MATTTELARGYRFELAGSIQFPVPSEIYDDLGFDACPIYEPEVQSAAIGPSGEPPLLLHSDPGQAVRAPERAHGPRGRPRHGRDRRLGRRPGPGHRPVRRADASQVARRDVRLRHQRDGAPGHPHGHVRQRDGRHRPAPARSGRATPRCAACWPSSRSTPRSAGPYSEGSALCLAFALASPTGATMSKVKGGIGTLSDHLAEQFEQHGGELRRHVKVAGHRSPRPAGWSASAWPTARRSARRSWCPTSTRRPRSPSCSTGPTCRTTSCSGSTPSTTGPLYFQMHFALDGLPEWASPYEELNDGRLSHNVTFFGTPEEMQADFEGCVRGLVPRSPSFNLSIPSLRDPDLAPPGQARGQQLRLLRPHRGGPRRPGPAARRDGGPDAGQAHPRWRRTSPTWWSGSSTIPPTPTSGCSAAPGATSATGCSSPSSWGRSGPGPGAGPTARCRSRASTCAAPDATGARASRSSPGYNCGYEVLDGPPTGSA